MGPEDREGLPEGGQADGQGTGLTELEGPLTVSGPCSATNPTSHRL